MDSNTIKNRCDGKCENCNINQRTYCAAQIAYYNQEEIGQIKAILANIAVSSEESVILKKKVYENALNEPMNDEKQEM